MPFFPPPEKRDGIAFRYFKALSYKARMTLAALLLAGGVLAQLAGFFRAGLALVALGSAMGMVKGYNAAPEIAGGEGRWERVTPDEYRKIREKAAQLEKWDRDVFDVTSARGLGLLALVALLCFAGYTFVFFHLGSDAAFYLAADAVAVFLGQWVSGTREYLKQDKLIIKIQQLANVMAMLADSSAFQVFPMLLLKKTKEDKDVPADARLMIKLPAAPAGFYGVQTQVSINSIQGTDYPYLYCVLVAKKGGDLLGNYKAFTQDFDQPPGVITQLASMMKLRLPGDSPVIFEPSSDGEVDVLVVRQFTTRTGGYHTDEAQAARVVRTALGLAEKMLSRPVPPKPAAQALPGSIQA